MELKIENHLLKVDGKYYRVRSVDGKDTLIRVNKKEVDRKFKIIKELASKLKDNLEREVVMREALGNLPLKELEKLDKMIKSKRKYKPKTREKHCADMKVGNFIIPIVDN